MQRLFWLIALLCSTWPAQAQTAPPYDQAFLRSEQRSSAYELAIARLATERATRPEIKAYAATLVHDHEAYDGALRDLAAKKGVALPSGVSAQGRAALDRLAHHTGPRFDRAFIAEARRVNAADMRDFRAEAARSTDTDIGGFVAGFLPMDEQHEAAARALSETQVAGRMPIIRPPAGARTPVIKPPAGGPMPVIPPKP